MVASMEVPQVALTVELMDQLMAVKMVVTQVACLGEWRDDS
jgi:hypothetical protein